MSDGLKFFGCTVKSFSPTLGWSSQPSSVRISLVQDIQGGDLFVPTLVGELATVQFGSLHFTGLVRDYKQGNDESGFPIYEVNLEDPRQILEGCEVILDEYSGSTFGTPNLLNIYGYWENLLGFGGANNNDSGTPWNKIASAVQTMSTSPIGTYGGPLQYKGYSYGVDLSLIPAVPDYYRIPGQSLSLLRCIEQVCKDTNHDFFIDFHPGTTIIRVRTVNRRLPPPAGVLSNFIDEQTLSGICIRSSKGVEMRNEPSSAFITGGLQSILHTETTCYSYFGLDYLNNPIVGVRQIPDDPYSVLVNLNCSEIYDIIGSYVYPCYVTEMLCALWDIETWTNYIQQWNTDLSLLFSGWIVPINQQVGALVNGQLPADAINLTQLFAQQNGQNLDAETGEWIRKRVYEWLLRTVNNYLGKQFLVEIPFVLQKIEDETFRLVNSHVPSNAGYEEGGPPELPIGYEDFALTEDNRCEAYCKYTYEAMDLSKINKSGSVLVTETAIFAKMQVEQGKVYFINHITPCAHVTVSDPIHALPDSSFGPDISVVAEIMGWAEADLISTGRAGAGGTLKWQLATLPVQPSTFYVPLQSNILTYGPWYAVGSQGKVSYRSDSSLVPWNYGGEDIMNLTANCMVADAISWQSFTETGEMELVGEPVMNLGDKLLDTGPVCTGMTVNYNASAGITTSYRFQTFSPKFFNAVSFQGLERIKNIALATQRIGRDTRKAIHDVRNPGRGAAEQTAFAYKTWLERSGFAQGRSTHPLLVAESHIDMRNPNHRRTETGTVSLGEVTRNWSADQDGPNSQFTAKASASLNSMYRPCYTRLVGTNAAGAAINLPAGIATLGDLQMATYWKSESQANYNYAMTVDSASDNCIDPFINGNDIEILLKGDTYTDAHNQLTGSTGQNTQRIVVHRGPMVLSGWCWSMDGGWLPGNNESSYEDLSIVDDYLKKSHLWKTGPLEMLFDNERGVYSPGGICSGITKTECGPQGGHCRIDLYEDSDTKIEGRRKDRTVYNFMSRAVPADTRVHCGFNFDAKCWYILSADCT